MPVGRVRSPVIFQIQLVIPHRQRSAFQAAAHHLQRALRLRVFQSRKGGNAAKVLGSLQHGDRRTAAVIADPVENDLMVRARALPILDPLSDQAIWIEVVHVPVRVVAEDPGSVASLPVEGVVRKLGRVVPADLLGDEKLEALATENLRNRPGITEGVGCPGDF